MRVEVYEPEWSELGHITEINNNLGISSERWVGFVLVVYRNNETLLVI